MRVIIADDEPLARQALRRVLVELGDVEVIAEADDVPSLRAILGEASADVLFLDITMPGGTGFDALPGRDATTALVFTTAHEEHAARAFAVDAVDYLVKPFGRTRVEACLAKVRRHLGRSREPAAREPLRTILVRVGTRQHPVAVESIWRIEGADDFIRIVTADRSTLHGMTMRDAEAQLDHSMFIRIHRRHLVNIRAVARVVPHGDRRLALEFADGSRVVSSRAGAVLLRAYARAPAAPR